LKSKKLPLWPGLSDSRIVCVRGAVEIVAIRRVEMWKTDGDDLQVLVTFDVFGVSQATRDRKREGHVPSTWQSVYALTSCHSAPLYLNPVQQQEAKIHGASRSGDRKSHANAHGGSFPRRSAGRCSKVRALKDARPILALRRNLGGQLRYFTSNAGFRHPTYSVKPATNSRDAILGIFQCVFPPLQ
jgi:hypothetical protein